MTTEDAAAHAANLARRLGRNRSHMRAWNTTWFSIFTATTIAQGALAITSDFRGDKAVYGLGAARAGLGALSIPILGVRTVDLKLEGSPCADLLAAEKALRENVRLHAKGRGWFKHTGVVALNTAAFLYLGFAFDEWPRAALGGVVGIAVGEIQIFTQPMGSRDILSSYRDGLGPVPPAATTGWHLMPYATGDSVGLALVGASL